MVSVGAISFSVATNYGMGDHFFLLSPSNMESLLICHFLFAAGYNCATALIKMSLLFQYLRAFDCPTWTRRFTQVLLVLIGIWGLVFAFLAWFPCLPDPSTFWRLEANRKGCYGGGSPDPKVAVAAIYGHGGSNMGFDILVLALAFRLLLAREANGVGLMGKVALLTLGTL
jgi:hypothetical protein